jgi:hypothetical protein
MSGALSAVAGIASFVSNILIQPSRAIAYNPTKTTGGAPVDPSAEATIIPDCAVSERGMDRMQITQHPVEQGAAISDHCYKMPPEVHLSWNWTNCKLSGGPGFVQNVYDELLALQERRQPFDLFTGKRYYPNIVLAALAISTDNRSEEALLVTAVCQQVIIVETQASAAPASGEKADQAKPEETAPTNKTGTQQADPKPTKQPSLLSKMLPSGATIKGTGDTYVPHTGSVSDPIPLAPESVAAATGHNPMFGP